MQLILFTEYFLQTLDKSEGILAKPLKIIEELYISGHLKEALESIERDQLTGKNDGRQKRWRFV